VKRYLVMGDESVAQSELQGGPVVQPAPVPRKHVEVERLVVHNGGNGDKQGLKSLLRTVKGEAERTAISRALDETHWNRKAAARLLNISYRALLYKIQQYDMAPPESYLSQVAPVSRPKGSSHGE
jgi:two-component system, NtrC family, response regulator AtoC